MSGDTLYQAPRRHNVSKTRVHDYLYDSAFIVSGARDYARSAFRAAMESAQVVIQPVYKTMFSELRKYPSVQISYHPNCRLPEHMDRTYSGYLQKVYHVTQVPAPVPGGKDRFKFSAMPKKVLPIPHTSPDFHPSTPTATPLPHGLTKPITRGMQTMYRESSAQTHPWQPDGKPAEGCEGTPEVMHLDKLEWGPGDPYRLGDLPADFHTTEIINKLRHARQWGSLVEGGRFPCWMKKRDAIINDIETKDWIFREAEIDELQEIRLSLLHQLQNQQRTKSTNRSSLKLAKLWNNKKKEMEHKITAIHRTRDREVRKLSALHTGGGRLGLVQRLRAARGHGSAVAASSDPTSDLYAPLARNGYQASRRHAEITYEPGFLLEEDHRILSEPPAWLEGCGQNLGKTCSGHWLPRDPAKLCERETKWSEQFLENLHNDLKKARLGAAEASAGPLRVLKLRRLCDTPRPETPEVEEVQEDDETCHQAALALQRAVRGRAVHTLMYEGRSRAAELTEELKTTHGLQKEDKLRIAREETKARDYNAIRSEEEHKEDAISALVEELCGGCVSAALSFLEKELRRLKEERRQHAFILIALRDKTMREAGEAGRRQKEEQRRKEHDEMFKQVLGVTQETIDAYFQEISEEAVVLAAEEDAVATARMEAEKVDAALKEHHSLSSAEQNETVAELVQHFLLPEAHREAARQRISGQQSARLAAVRDKIFTQIDDAEIRQDACTRCGNALDDFCRCRTCPITQEPVETEHRHDPRWKHTRRRPQAEPKERFPPEHDFRYMLNYLVDDSVAKAREHRGAVDFVSCDLGYRLRLRMEVTLDAKDIVDEMIDFATGAKIKPEMKKPDYRHLMTRRVGDALARSQPHHTSPCPEDLPSELRRKAEELALISGLTDTSCRCEEPVSRVHFGLDSMTPEEIANLLPSELRVLEEMRRCKCDSSAERSPRDEPTGFAATSPTEYTDTTTTDFSAVADSDHE